MKTYFGGIMEFGLKVIVLVVCVAVFLILHGRERQDDWNKNYGLAKNKLSGMGFKLAAPGESVLIDDGVAVLMNDDSSESTEDYVKESLKSFEMVCFGNQITVYVHKSGNLAFMITESGAKVSRFVFEK